MTHAHTHTICIFCCGINLKKIPKHSYRHITHVYAARAVAIYVCYIRLLYMFAKYICYICLLYTFAIYVTVHVDIDIDVDVDVDVDGDVNICIYIYIIN
jgi:hypothetical protein